MSFETISNTASMHYGRSFQFIQDEVRALVEKGTLSRHQPIYSLCQYIPAREWVCVESELENNDYLLRDRIGDLLSTEIWEND